MRHITPTEQVQYIKQSRFICSACGSSRDCDCNAPALERVVAYDKANPGKSTRQAAADLGVSKSEVNRARRSPVPDGTPVTKVTPATVTGRDGKTYPARQQPKAEEPDTEDVAASAAHGVAPTSKAADQKHAKEIIRLTKEVHAARREIARLKQKYEHKPDIHNGMTVPERLIAHLKEAFQLMEEQFDEWVVEGAPNEISEQTYHDAIQKYRPALQETWRNYFAEHRLAAVLSPVVRMPAPQLPKVLTSPGFDIEINGKMVPARVAFARNIAPSSSAGLASVVLPAGMASELPIGIELDGPAASDLKLLSLALATERLLEFNQAPKI